MVKPDLSTCHFTFSFSKEVCHVSVDVFNISRFIFKGAAFSIFFQAILTCNHVFYCPFMIKTPKSDSTGENNSILHSLLI